MAANTEHKDRIFKFLFGSPERPEFTLSLYNAVNGSDYDNPEDIRLNTIDDALYLGMKNDVSFIIMDEMHLWEHQSSYNPNMPMRFFMYAAKLYEKYITDGESDYYQYSKTTQPVPCPKCICFYNGTGRQPDKKILKLSDAFRGSGDIEVRVTMLNINYGRNAELMKNCKPVEEYSWLVDAVRRHYKITKDLEAAVDAALEEMPDDFIIKRLLLLNKAEVKGMFLTEWDQEKVLAQERRDSEKRINTRVVRNMLKKNFSLDTIKEITQLSEEVILSIAKKIGVNVTV